MGGHFAAHCSVIVLHEMVSHDLHGFVVVSLLPGIFPPCLFGEFGEELGDRRDLFRGQPGVMTLFVPPSSSGFVSAEDGRVRVRQIVIPVSHAPHLPSVVHAVGGLVHLVQAGEVSCHVLHGGTHDRTSPLALPHESGCSWTEIVQQGDIVGSMLEYAKDHAADLIAMTTHGHKGFLDALRGSITERVVREARCPVLAIPAWLR